MNDLKEISDKIAIFVSNWLREHQGFKQRTFYAESFALALLSRTKNLDQTTKDLLLDNYSRYDKQNSSFHWEFNLYALIDAGTYDPKIKQLLNYPQWTTNGNANWRLLRSVVRMRLDPQSEQLTKKEVKETLGKYQLKSGLIIDQKGVRSFQYHCFSTALLGEIFNLTKDLEIKKSFLIAIDFICHFILPNGDTTYVGRGQQQSFGYSSLAYALSLAYDITNSSFYLGDLQKILSQILKFQRKNGDLPLVFNNENSGQEKQSGWYAYNNHFDYLCFSGLFLHKAFCILQGKNFKIANRPQLSYRDHYFQKIVTNNYTAVLSLPGGQWTNDLPFPYIYSSDSLTPCYGGEQFVTDKYSLKGIPLPFRHFFISIFWGKYLLTLSLKGIHIRSFTWGDSSITVKNRTLSFFRIKDNYLFFPDVDLINGKIVHPRFTFHAAHHSFTKEAPQWCALGELKSFSLPPNNEIRMEIL